MDDGSCPLSSDAVHAVPLIITSTASARSIAALRIEVSGQMSALSAENEAKLARAIAQGEADSAAKEKALAQVIELKEENQETQSLREMVDLMRGQLEKEYAMRTKAETVRKRGGTHTRAPAPSPLPMQSSHNTTLHITVGPAQDQITGGRA